MNNNKYTAPDDFVDLKISEVEAIQLILSAFEGNGKYSDLNVFNNILYGTEYLKNWRQYTGCYCLTNVLTKNIGLNSIEKPGEIDIILIPFDSTNIYYDKTSAFEVKILKPTAEKITKGPNSDGYSQTMGLVKLGFPYIGLIHIVVSKPLPEIEKREIQFFKRPANLEDVSDDIPKVEEYEMIKWDWLPFYSETNQKKRLLSYDFPKYVGLKTLTMNFYKNGDFVLGYTNDLKDFETGYLNPHKKKNTVDMIKQHHEKYPIDYRRIALNFP